MNINEGKATHRVLQFSSACVWRNRGHGKSRRGAEGGGGGKSCQDRLFTQGLIENAVSHRAIRLGNLRGSFEIEPEEFLCYAPLSQKFSRKKRFLSNSARIEQFAFYSKLWSRFLSCKDVRTK